MTRRRVGGFDPNGLASAVLPLWEFRSQADFMGSQISHMSVRLHFYQTVVFIGYFPTNTQMPGSMVTPMENYMGNLIPIEFSTIDGRLPRQLLARTMQWVRTASGIGAGPRNRIGNGTERYRTHQIFDVTNPKKVGGSTTGHATHHRFGGGREATPRRSRRYEASVSRMLNGTSRQIWT